ncbi:chromosome partitioning protein ParA [Adhaeribacter arboris]|uniref:Chromosome partitioning protein ParA n=1 Tax=Adhaeribacter arboris TaxID=2072846 RepID=A0A2T2Y9I8_9BACT|nr:ROK family protein [Adhaeribacter arboris]PSR52177.1 chromosome partitioning protein ParA [Adhaeribacter arboris]
MKSLLSEDRILSVDIGGSNIKATILDAQGNLLNEYKKLPTPLPAAPEKVIATIQELVKDFSDYNKVSVGFPGYVRNGRVFTAPNLDTELWRNVCLQEQLKDALNKPVRLVNDADLQGLGVVKGQGLEMVITLGTGFGTALLLNGNLLPHLELAHHPVSGRKSYDYYVGERAFRKHGEEKWNQRMERVLKILKAVFNYDHLYISGGNASKIRFNLDENITIVSNRDGIKGGTRLWLQEDHHFSETCQSAFKIF